MADNWTDKLRTEMEEFQSMDIPEGLWEGIEQELDAKRRVTPWRRYIAVAAVALLVCGSVGILFMHNASEHPDTIAKIVRKAINKEPVHADNTENANLADLKVSHSPSNLISYKCPEPIRCGEALPSDAPTLSDNLATTQHPSTTTQHPTPNTQHPTSNTQHPSPITHHPSPITHHPSPNTQHPSPITHHPSPTTHHPSPITQHPSPTTHLSARIFTAMSSQGDTPAKQGYTALSASGMPDNQTHVYSKSPFGKLDNLYLANALDTDEEVVSEAEHSLPVRFGVSVGYDLDSRWTLNAGVVYTKLHSTLTSGTSSSYYTNNQNIHYLGIPLSLHYNVLSTSHFRLYGAAGGMVEFGVKGDVEVTNITKNALISTEHNTIKDIPVQYSANAALGAEYDIAHGIGIYAEPGLSYYFKNNANLSTSYSAHPLNFNLQVGLRWNIVQK